MEIKIEQIDDATIVAITGRIDTANSSEFEKTVAPVIQGNMKNVVLDCSNLSYISSSGLRIFLGMQKAALSKKGHLTIHNLNDELMKIFVMTGFSKMFVFE
ncbi:MAG: STAS domain-containing protein [Bacteroidales bacterium]|jgi:anti-sigma B factor antagonist|nr:STAS domain-containing protein [Bacteroidales bacterium]MDD3151641.1 STAS domain-containing protein [Bacteroidales bacterium]MDD3914024.1 STAS domain-containing protein [Bacteroidales bacterium]MDD4633874.1 STAS domain-containing protein [Bacteroidales bacterium]